MPTATQSNDALVAAHCVNILLAIADGESAVKAAITNARIHFAGWSLHNAVQFATGKRFMAVLGTLSNPASRFRYAMARIIARDVARETGWSGAVRAGSDPAACEREARALLETLAATVQ